MSGTMRLKSLADAPEPEDGTRILVTRHRPRGDASCWDEWFPGLAPTILREDRSLHADEVWEWYLHTYYLREMRREKPASAIRTLRGRLDNGETITLLCVCHDERHCHRSLLRDLILGGEQS